MQVYSIVQENRLGDGDGFYFLYCEILVVFKQVQGHIFAGERKEILLTSMLVK